MALAIVMLSVGVACGEDRSTRADEALTEAPPGRLTEAEFRFGNSAEGEVFFTRPEVRADPARNRIFTVDRPNHQVSALTPDGALLFRVGRKGDGPGEFIDLGSMHIEADGSFTVREAIRGRYTRFTAQGELVGTTLGPRTTVSYQGLPVELHWLAGGSYLGTVIIPNQLESGWEGLAPVTRMPLVRVRDLGDGLWSDPEPLLWLDISNRMHLISFPGDLPFAITSQPFGDPDHVRFEPGAAVVMRSKGHPGTVELIEVDSDGDTTWHRRVELAPDMRLTSAMVDEVVEDFVAGLVSQGYLQGSLDQDT